MCLPASRAQPTEIMKKDVILVIATEHCNVRCVCCSCTPLNASIAVLAAFVAAARRCTRGSESPSQGGGEDSTVRGGPVTLLFVSEILQKR